MSAIYEKFVKWYLRFNEYFTIENFIVHAADNPNRIRGDFIAPYTETDIIAIRMPYSIEITSNLYIANHEILVSGQNKRFDVVIAEVKSRENNRPNSVWREKHLRSIQYIVRFIGLFEESQIDEVAKEFAEHYCFENEKNRMRYIIFARNINQYYEKKGLHLSLL